MAKAAPSDTAEMRYTVALRGRTPEVESLTPAEVTAMWQLGFRFAIFRPEQGEYTLSRPHTLAHNLVRDTLTITQ